MKNYGILRIVVVGLLVCLSGVAAQAQDQMLSKFDIFAGYSFASHHQDNSANANLHGYGFGFVYNLSRNVGFEASFGGHAGDSTPFSSSSTSTQINIPPFTGGFIGQPSTSTNTSHSHQKEFTFLFGPKLTHHAGNFQLFTHILVGGVRARDTGYFTNTFSQVFTATGPPAVTLTQTSDNVNIQYTTGTGFGFKTGGGVDWVHGHWGLRILQIDYLYAHGRATGTQTSINNFTQVCTPASAGSCSGKILQVQM